MKHMKAHPAPSQRMTRSRTKAAANIVMPDIRYTLDNIPFETLQIVCEYVAGSQPSALHALSQVNKRCLAASSATLFREIVFDVVSRKKLQRDVDRFRSVLDSRSGWNHVHRVCIEGRMPRQKIDNGRLKGHPSTVRARKQRRVECAEAGELATPPRYRGRGPLENPKNAYDNDDAWQALVGLLESMPALTDLVYSCEEQFPPSLLRMLHRHHAHCRLHLNRYRLHSLVKANMDLHERNLATSPCLYAVSLECHGFVHGELDPYIVSEAETNLEVSALVRLVVGAASNLSEVRLTAYAHVLPTAWAQTIEPSKNSLPPLHPGDLPLPGRTASLTKLALGTASRNITHADLAVWTNLTNFSALRILKFESAVDDDALVWATTNCSFTSLETLVLDLNYYDINERKLELRPQVSDFLRSLSPLKTLKISGIVSPSNFQACVQRHAPTLRRLWFGAAMIPGMDSNAIGILQEHPMPLLEDLALSIKRSKGDESEVAIYKVLGALPRLQTLNLTLDCADFTVCRDQDMVGNEVNEDYDRDQSGASFDAFHQQIFQAHCASRRRQPHYGHIRDAFINSALDAKLARDIYQAISTAKGSCSVPLLQLRLRPEGGCLFGGIHEADASRTVCDHVGRSWLLQRNPPGGDSREVVVMEVNESYRLPRAPKLDPQTETIFRRLWPTRSDATDDWREDWCSFPLSESALAA